MIVIITKSYIMKHRTDKGAWTQPQLEALGIDWPPRKGWIDRACGKELSNANQIQFESRIGIKQVRKNKKKIHYSDGSFEARKAEALENHRAITDLDRESIAEAKKWL